MKKLYLSILILCLLIPTVSAWEVIPGNGLNISAFAESANGDRIVLGLDLGGIWLSNDAGSTWTPINNRLVADTCSVYEVRELIMFDADGDTIFARTRHDDYEIGTIFMSLNGGETWDTVNTPGDYPPRAWDIYKFDPQSFNHRYFLNSVNDLYETTNGGLDWTYKTRIQFIDGFDHLTIDAIGADTLYATCEGYTNGMGVITSHDGGSTWYTLTGFADIYDVTRVYFAPVVSLSNGEVLAIPKYGTNGEGEVYHLTSPCRSLDKGVTWSLEEESVLPDKFSAFDAFEIDNYPGHILVVGYGDAEVALSTNYGHSFQQIIVDSENPGLRFNSISQDANSSLVYINSQRNGSYKSADGGETWVHVENLVPLGFLHDFRVNPDYLSIASLNYKTNSYDIESESWITNRIEGFTVPTDSVVKHEPVLDLGNGTLLIPSIIRHRTYNSQNRYFILRSENNGESWNQVNIEVDGILIDLPKNGWLYSYIDAEVCKLLYIVYDNGQYTYYSSADRGLTWNPSTQHQILDGYIDFELTRDGIFAAHYNGVYKSTDNGNTWTDTELPGDFSSYGSANLGYDKQTNIIYAYNLGYVPFMTHFFKYDGNEWIALGDSEPLTDIEIVQTWNVPAIIGLDYHYHIFISVDGGGYFEDITGDIPYPGYTSVLRLPQFDLYNNRIWCASTLGLMYSNVEDYVYVDDENSPSIPLTSKPIYAYPNPFNASINISFKVEKTGPVVLKLYNIAGQEVATLVDEVKQIGYQEMTFDASSLSSGTYFLKFNDGTDRHSQKITLVK